MSVSIRQKRWRGASNYMKEGVENWSEKDMGLLVRFYEAAGLEVPRFISLRMTQLNPFDLEAPKRPKTMPLRAWRRKQRRDRIKKHGSIRKMRLHRKAERLKEQRWAVLREQGLPLRDAEALVWYLRANMWKKDNDVTSYGYLRSSTLEAVAGGSLPVGIDFDKVFAALRGDANEKYEERKKIKDAMARINEVRNLKKHYSQDAQYRLKKAIGSADFRVKYTLDIYTVIANPGQKIDASMTLVDKAQRQSRWSSRNRRSTEASVSVKNDWYRKVYLRGLANAFGKETLVLDVAFSGRDGGEIALLAHQPSPHRYALKVEWVKFGQKPDGTYWFEEE